MQLTNLVSDSFYPEIPFGGHQFLKSLIHQIPLFSRILSQTSAKIGFLTEASFIERSKNSDSGNDNALTFKDIQNNLSVTGHFISGVCK